MAKHLVSCSVDGCNKPNHARGLCKNHYERLRLDGAFGKLKERRCLVNDCQNSAHRLGLCWAHYFRNRRHGDPKSGRTFCGARHKFLHEVVLPYEGEDCLVWPFSRTKGYGIIIYKGRQTNVTNVICELVHGPAPTSKHQAAHSCGNGHLGCCNPHHLSWKTPKENRADCIIHGTQNIGERNGGSKLTKVEVLRIRAMSGQMYHREIAAIFGVSRAAVGDIINRRRWSWLKDEGDENVSE